MKDVSVIIPAAGEGKRLGKTSTPKPFICFKVKGKRIPLLLITLQRFLRCSEVSEVIIAVHPRHLQQARRLIRNKIIGIDHFVEGKVIKLVVGGKHRSDSVANALKIIDPKSRFILVHDAARPLVSPNLIRCIISATRKYGAVLPVLPVTDTIKRVGSHHPGRGKPGLDYVKETIKPRQELYISQTPQGFQREILIKAYKQTNLPRWQVGKYLTDEASLVENLGYPVKIVAGDPRNIKLTTPLDKIIIHALLKPYGFPYMR